MLCSADQTRSKETTVTTMNSDVPTQPDVHTDEAPVGSTIVSVGQRSEPILVDASRYRSREWAEIEEERVWPRVWQLACTLDITRAHTHARRRSAGC